ncbi:sensor histidine kinase [Streptomyces nymphaeiformis]|uniref:histidine kinase n=1 Tax=Streptomyces nymphaeiformis TaxID=2663842 RepID=A0A7W7X9H9_9ACTN|nr:histidine kinase [Streptomyces nymphaeiformis]MBB4980434.1 signal transduction histidine kinase [Streptomyces nymphaeiformis]
MVKETAGVAVAALCLWAVALLWDLPRAGFHLFVILVAVAIFPLRRRWPDAALLALAVLAGAAPGAGPVTAAAAYTVAIGMVRPRHRVRLLGGASALIMASATAAGPEIGPGSAVYGLELGLAMAVAAVVVPGLVGTVSGQQARLLCALRERGDAAERARRSADSEARLHERSAIAAEMHDLVGHRLSLISLHAGGLELALAKAAPELREEAVLVRHTTRDAMRELRQALGVLGPLGRDTGPDALTDATGTRADIETLVAESRDGGIAVRLEWSGPDLDALPARVRRAVHRVVRESLTNVHRYAAASHVTVRVEHDNQPVRVTVRNGAPPASVDTPSEAGTGRGLAGLRERVELLGGTLDAGALPSGGFQVTAVVPAEPDDTVASKPLTTGEAASPSDGRDNGFDNAAALSRTPRTARALTFVLGAAALWMLMALAIALVCSQPRGMSPPVKPRLGMTYQELKGVFDSPAVRAAATGHEPPRPADAVGCVYPPAGPGSQPGAFPITRYCFDAAQRLISIDRFTVPSVRDAPPWETS